MWNTGKLPARPRHQHRRWYPRIPECPLLVICARGCRTTADLESVPDRGGHRPAPLGGSGRRYHRYHHGQRYGPGQPARRRRGGAGDLPRDASVAATHDRRARAVHDRVPGRRRAVPAHCPLHRDGARAAHRRPAGGRRPARRRDSHGTRRRAARAGDGHRPAYSPRARATDPGVDRARPVSATPGPAADRRVGSEPHRHPSARRRGHRRHRLDRRGVLGGRPAHHGQRHHARRAVVRLGRRTPGRRALHPRGHEHLRRGPRTILGRARRLHHAQRHQRAPRVVHLHPAGQGSRLGRTDILAVQPRIHPESARRGHGRADRREPAVRVRRRAGALARAGAHLARHGRPVHARTPRREPRLGRALHRPRAAGRHTHHHAGPAGRPRHGQHGRPGTVRLEYFRRADPDAAPRRPLDVATTHPARGPRPSPHRRHLVPDRRRGHGVAHVVLRRELSRSLPVGCRSRRRRGTPVRASPT